MKFKILKILFHSTWFRSLYIHEAQSFLLRGKNKDKINFRAALQFYKYRHLRLAEMFFEEKFQYEEEKL